MFKKILVANRGEIALRIQRACREMGIQTVMVFSQGDENANYLRLGDEAVCIGPAAADKSYLNAAAIISAAEITAADAVHPGYGFLSENADFAEMLKKSGFAFIGSPADIIRTMGDKVAAKTTVKKYGLQTVPGSDGALDRDDKAAAAQIAAIGFPAIIKAAAGGGGRGMRVVNTQTQAENTIAVLRQEALSAFGNDELYAEKFLQNPRHVEVQVLADGKSAIHLGTRDCSLQRRHQKIIEEAPAFGIRAKKLDAVCQDCVAVCRKLGYVGAGTFEFLYEDGEFYFIEMNTRLQVEHTVTEMITGVDIVAEQIKIAAGERLALRQKDVAFRGHSLQCRINAEDPETFLPQPGDIRFLHAPGGLGVRVDSHIYAGYSVPPYYDSLLSKLITFGDSRQSALERMRGALKEYVIEGVATNLPLHIALVQEARFVSGNVSINYLAARAAQP